MEEIQIVTLLPEDWEKYRQIRLRSLKEEPQAFLSTHERSSKEPGQKWKGRLEQAMVGEVQWLSFVQKGKELVGMAGAFVREEKDSAEVISVFVAKEVRGQGIGKKLLSHLLTNIRKNPAIKYIHLEVNTTQPSAVALYTSCGFTPVKRLKRVLGDGKEYEDMVMELNLIGII